MVYGEPHGKGWNLPWGSEAKANHTCPVEATHFADGHFYSLGHHHSGTQRWCALVRFVSWLRWYVKFVGNVPGPNLGNLYGISRNLGGGNSNMSFGMFTPKVVWGKWTHFDEHIFQMGLNHQLGKMWCFCFVVRLLYESMVKGYMIYT